VSHANARLNHYGRGLLITRVLEEGWTAAAAAEASGVSRATVYKWLARFRTEGLAGLRDRSSCPAPVAICESLATRAKSFIACSSRTSWETRSPAKAALRTAVRSLDARPSTAATSDAS
jgi:transposase